MGKSATLILPHAANGIELGDFAIEFRADKIVAFRRTVGDHFTLHAGNNSGVIDIHRTWKDAQGCEHHATIFAMRRDNILPFLNELSSLPRSVIQLVRDLRLGWLGHRHIGIAWGLSLIDQDHISRVTRRKSGRKRLVLDPNKFVNEIRVPEYLEEVWDWPDGPFSLLKGGRMIGIAFKASDAHGNVKLAWIKLRDMGRLSSQMQHRIVQVALRYAIPRDEYHNYPVLV